MYFGCHDGTSCRISDLVLEKNRIDGVTASDQEVGYGIQVKLNSTATIRENIIKNTKGPSIMVYGSQDPALESLIERNFVAGSKTSSGIVIGGGPVVVRNNIAVGNTEAGIGVENYGSRNLLRGIRIGLNTVYGNVSGGITLPKGKVADTQVVGNAGWSPASVENFPASQSGLIISENLTCEKACFADPEALDFSPARDSRLDRTALTTIPSWLGATDFFGGSRKNPPRVGAVETATHAGPPAVIP
ncbi:MAG TPA: right-handed parallel beta-helix repeat-containing protein, partial [Candidatus Binatus sp.]|nr:right-handed parallel beta-helix repeat-containing protein [Candidatus Binatus sp.]